MEALLSFGLSNAVLATALAVVVAGLARVARHRPLLVHTLWLLVLLRLILPPFWYLPVSLFHTPEAGFPADAPPPQLPSALLPSLDPAPIAGDSDSQSSGTQDLALPAPALPTVDSARPAGVVQAGLPEIVAGLWLSGTLAWWTLAAVRLARFHRHLRAAWPAPDAVLAQAQALAQRMGLRRCPSVAFVPAAISPLLLALGPRPRLLLPASLWQRLSSEQQQAVLAHELAHLRRGDPWVRRLELLVLGLYWWHPVAWWARRRLHEAEEQCCDRWVLDLLPTAATSYAAALVETLAYLSACRAPLPVLSSGLGQLDSWKRRLTMILQDTRPRPLSRPILLLLGLAFLLLPLLPGWAESPRTPPGPPADPQAPSAAQTSPPSAADPLPPAALPQTGQRPEDDRRKEAEIEALRNEIARLRSLLGQGARDHQIREAQLQALRAREEQAAREARQAGDAARLPGSAARVEARPGMARPPAATQEASLQEAHETVELLEAQVQARQAELHAAVSDLAFQVKQLERIRQLGEKGAVDAQMVEEAAAKKAAREAEVQTRKANLVEPTIRLKQAQRRLMQLTAGMQVPGLPGAPGRAVPAVTPPVPQSPAERMQSLEQKLAEIARELEALRRDLAAPKK